MKKKLISRIAAAVGMCVAVAVAIPAVSVLNMFRSVSIAAEPSDVSSSSEAASDVYKRQEFDMTEAVQPGENEVTIQVYRFCSINVGIFFKIILNSKRK